MNKIDRYKILIRYAVKNGLIASQKDLGQLIGYSNESYMSQIINGKVEEPKDFILKLKTIIPDLNEIWLNSGEGEMLGSTQNETATNSDDCVVMVPIVHIDSVGGMHSPNAIVGETQYIEGYAPFVDARDGDICIIQSGDSMVPTCPSGSLLLLRQVDNWKEYFGYGNIFVLELTDGRRITKEVTRYDEDPKHFIWCVSHNPGVPDEELPRNMIRSVWKVIKIQINKGW